MIPRSSSIRTRLLRRLLLPLTLLFLFDGWVAYRAALQAVNSAYDRSLLASVLAISEHTVLEGGGIIVDLPFVALALLETDFQDRVYYQVMGEGGQYITGYPDFPAPRSGLPPEVPLYYDTTYLGEKVRVAARHALVGPPERQEKVLVQVAETVGKRSALIREILRRVFLFHGLLILMTVAIVWIGITEGLSPLRKLREEIIGRPPEDLTRINLENTPREVAPLIDAVNQMRCRLQTVWEVQRRFISDASHQLKSPLTMFRAQAELGLRQETLESMRSCLEVLHRNTQAAGHLVSQMLSLARAEPGTEQTLALRHLDLAKMAREVCRERVPSAIGKGVDLGYEGDSTAEIRGEEFLIKELLTNLIDNAMRYGKPRGKITVGLRNEPGAVTLTVEDDGPGVPPQEREKVFDRFYRIPGTKGDGCGLGLSIVHQIAKAHGAAVRLMDAPGDGGLRVEIRFPAASRGDA